MGMPQTRHLNPTMLVFSDNDDPDVQLLASLGFTVVTAQLPADAFAARRQFHAIYAKQQLEKTDSDMRCQEMVNWWRLLRTGGWLMLESVFSAADRWKDNDVMSRGHSLVVWAAQAGFSLRFFDDCRNAAPGDSRVQVILERRDS